MIRFVSILAALWLSAASLLAAVGDILSTTVRADGWTAEVVIDNMVEGGIYNYGWSANQIFSTSLPKVVFTVTSETSTTSGVPTTKVRYVRGGMSLDTTDDPEQNADFVSGGDLHVLVTLEDWIYPDDVVTVTIANDWYVNGGANSSPVTGMSVTNGSTRPYFATDFVWTRPPFQRITGSTFTVGALASSHHALEGHPVVSVIFTATDGITTPQTVIVTEMTKNSFTGDKRVCSEYLATFDNTAFTQGATITVNAKAYPHIGDASNVFDSSTFAAQPSVKPGPQTFLCDKNSTYGWSIALVDPAAVDDTAGVAYDPATYNRATATPCKTVAGAFAKIAARNNSVHGRNDISASVVELKAGTSYLLFGATGAPGNSNPDSWAIVRPVPGLDGDDVQFSGSSGDADLSDRVKIENIGFTSPTNGPTGINALWLDQCKLAASSAPSSGQISGNTHIWMTGCDVPNWSNLRPYGSGLGGFKLMRGCDFSGYRGNMTPECFLGNIKNDRSSTSPSNPATFLQDGLGATSGPWESVFIAYNEIYGLGAMGVKYWDKKANAPLRGLTIMENLFEAVSTSVAIFQVSGGGEANQTFTGAKIWHNTWMGERHFFCYNDTGTAPVWYQGVEYNGNIAWEYNIKDNNHGGPGAANPARIGNWSVLYGVGQSGNLNADVGVGDQFTNRWGGINVRHDVWGTNTAFFDFLDFQATATEGGTGAAGLGDYRLGASSPARNLLHVYKTPYDLDGNPRGLPDAAGAYSTFSGNTPPSVTITSPTTGASTTSPVSLIGTATDAENGSLTASITWSSSIDGALGTGGSISPALSVGVHTITASVTDSGSLTDTDTISLTITPPGASGTLNATRINATTVRIQ
jgi:hypothetical protein